DADANDAIPGNTLLMCKRSQLCDDSREAGGRAKAGIKWARATGDDLSRQIRQENGQVAAADIDAKHMPSLGIEMERNGASTTSWCSIELVALAYHTLFEECLDNAADGGAREAGAARHRNAGEGTVLAHTIENEKAVERTHRTQVCTSNLPLQMVAAVAGLHATEDVADGAAHGDIAS